MWFSYLVYSKKMAKSSYGWYSQFQPIPLFYDNWITSNETSGLECKLNYLTLKSRNWITELLAWPIWLFCIVIFVVLLCNKQFFLLTPDVCSIPVTTKKQPNNRTTNGRLHETLKWTNNHQCIIWPFCPLDELHFFIWHQMGFITVHSFSL